MPARAYRLDPPGGLTPLSAWRLVRESVDVLLEGTPAYISLDEVQTQLAEIPGVHDLHVWTVASGVVAMSGYVAVEDSGLHQGILETAHGRLAALGIQHVTMQIEQQHTCEGPEEAMSGLVTMSQSSVTHWNTRRCSIVSS